MSKVFSFLILTGICVVECASKENATSLEALRKNSTTILNNETLTVNCNLDLLTNIAPWNNSLTINKIRLQDCLLPRQPLIEVFSKLNINAATIQDLLFSINDVNNTLESFAAANYLENLTLNSLEVSSNKRDLLVDNRDFFLSLKGLSKLNISGIDLQKLPKVLINSLTLDNVSLKSWENCEGLKTLNLRRIDAELTPNWPSQCRNLTILNLEEVKSIHSLATKILVSNLQELTIKESMLREVPYTFLAAANGLNYLDLSGNHLKDLAFSKLPVLPNLTSLDLSRNKLSGPVLIDLPSKLPAIQHLILDGNRFVHIFRNFQIKSAIIQFTNLERLSMNKMLLDPDCLMNTQFPKLQYLSLASSEPIPSLLLQSLPSTNASHLEIDFRGRPVRSIPVVSGDFQDKHLLTPTQLWPNIKSNLTLLVTYLDCDCNNAELARILHDYPHFLSMPNLRCNKETGPEISEEPYEKLDCKKQKIGDCIKRSWEHNSVVDCSNLMAEHLPWDEIFSAGVKGVNVSGNYISSLEGIDFGRLEWIDLRHNRISRLQNSELAQLFAVRSRRVWFAGNTIVCDCDNRALLRMLYSHFTQVPDYDTLTCVDHNVTISSLPVARVCKLGEGFIYGLCCAGSIFTVILMILFRCFGGWLKTFMYARGLCISCLEDKDPDADKTYDAFISFAHEDESFVIEHLLPRLELTPEPLRVCVHYRDWVVGDYIPAQIMRSIRTSKRTIIVLSKHLTESWWGVLEFRYAHAHAMSEGRSRLLVIVLDDVLEQKLDPELQGYLATNTFLRHDDPWFWDKLHYAMSHNTVRYY